MVVIIVNSSCGAGLEGCLDDHHQYCIITRGTQKLSFLCWVGGSVAGGEFRFKPCEKSKSIDQLKYALPIGDIIQFLVEVAVGDVDWQSV